MQRHLSLCTAWGTALATALAAATLLMPAASRASVTTPPQPALGAYLAGIVAGHLGDDQRAADLLLDALSHDPGATFVREPAFLFATLAGDPRAAALAGSSGTGLIAGLVLMNQAAAHGDWKRAADATLALPGSPLTEAIRPLLLAWALQGQGQTDQALRLLGAVPSGSPLAAVAALQAGAIADFAGRVPLAGRLYQTAQAVFPTTSLATVQLLGGYLARNGHPDAGKAMVQELARRLPILGMVAPGLVTALDRPVIADPAQGMARAYMAVAGALQAQADSQPPPSNAAPHAGTGPDQESGGAEAARFMLRFALDLDPSLTAARLSLEELLAADHPDAALAALSGVAPNDPLAPLVALRSATLEAACGQPAAAIAGLDALTKALALRPEPWQALGDVLSDQKRYPDAVSAYDHAIADRSRAEGQLAGDDWQLLFARAVAYDRQDQWAQARRDLDRALALSPTQPFVLNYLGYSLVERNLDLTQANLLIRRALDAKPDDGAIRDSLGWVMLHQGDVRGAVRTLERAAEQNPEDPTVNYHLGDAYWAAGRHTEAWDQWRWALVLDPDPSDLARIQASMNQAGVPQ